MVIRTAFASAALLVATIACAGEGPTSPIVPPPGPPQFVNGCDTYSPTSASIPIDSIQIFVRDTNALGCGFRFGEITPANGTAGFSQGSACALTTATGGIVFKVRGCAQGSVQLKIYSDSTKATLLQTIPIDVGSL